MKKIRILLLYIFIMLLLVSCDEADYSEEYDDKTTTYSVSENINDKLEENHESKESQSESEIKIKVNKNSTADFKLIKSKIPEYTGSAYVVINKNKPSFKQKDIVKKSYEKYEDLDAKGRCGVAMACIGQDIMPTEERGAIGQVKPTGWHTVKYDCVDGKYLYNRCHLIGYQLTGENANERNLITGTRYLNVDGMLPFENMIADYVKETDNHVMYRVTPIYDGNNLLAEGVEMEGYSVEDEGEGISFHVFCYNVQPGMKIDYKTGDSALNGEKITNSNEKTYNNSDKNTFSTNTCTYILNISSKKFHYPDCYSVKLMSESNKETYSGSRSELINMGYDPCGNCNP